MRRVLGLAASVFLLAGCLTTATKGTGDGWISSVVPGEQAHFTFAVSCDPKSEPCTMEASKVSGRFEDKGTGMKIRLDTVSAVTDLADPRCQTGSFTYTSEVRSLPGSGTGTATVCDGDARRAGNPGPGPHVRLPDTLSVQIFTGPFAGYANSGPLLGGNINIRFP